MPIHRIKHSFSAGEMSPLMNARLDFRRYNNGCRILKNMVCTTQGPTRRREGFRFVYSLNDLGIKEIDPDIRMIPFIFNEIQAYAMIFFEREDGGKRMVLGTDQGLVVVGAGPTVFELTLPADFDIKGFDWAQSKDEMHIAQSTHTIQIITRVDDDDWSIADAVYTDTPPEWDITNGFPERITFHQQRFVAAATTLLRQTVWLTAAGELDNWGDFTGGSGDADGFSFTLDSGTQNKIIWMNSSKALNLGTLGNEWTVTGNTFSAMTKGNVLAQRQTNNGGETRKPLMVGITTLFVERFGKVINEFVYDFNLDSYKTSDLAILSNHLTKVAKIIDWCYQQTPDSVIWAVREDGVLLGITYQRQHEVIGWHQHNSGEDFISGTDGQPYEGGKFKAITSIPGSISKQDEVWAVTERVTSVSFPVTGEEIRYYVEVMDNEFISDKSEDSEFLDSFVVVGGTTGSPVNTTDFQVPHLAGRTVGILADGAPIASARVDVFGNLNVRETVSEALIGLIYDSEVWPHLSEAGADSGTIVGRMQRITNVDIDLYKSLGFIIGRYDAEADEEIEEEVPSRLESDLTDTPLPLFTGIAHINFLEGQDREPIYFIRQNQPLPLTVRSVVDTIEVNE